MEENFDMKKLESVVRELQDKIVEEHKHLGDKEYLVPHFTSAAKIDGIIWGRIQTIEIINQYFNQNYAFDPLYLKENLNKPVKNA